MQMPRAAAKASRELVAFFMSGRGHGRDTDRFCKVQHVIAELTSRGLLRRSNILRSSESCPCSELHTFHTYVEGVSFDALTLFKAEGS